MKNYPFYSASRKNIFVWLTVLLSILAAVTRVVSLFTCPVWDLWTLVYMILPIVANLVIAVRLLRSGSDMFYVTIHPVFLYAIAYAIHVAQYGFGIPMKLMCIALLGLLALLYFLTFTGVFQSKLLLLLCLAACVVLPFIDRYLVLYVSLIWVDNVFLFASNIATGISFVTLVLCAKRMGPPKEGEHYRRRYGDRYDGRLLRSLDPFDGVMNYLMPTREESTNFAVDRFDLINAMDYIREKRRQGYKHFGINHLLIAAYVRMLNDYPGINRFISGQKVYAHFDATVCMVVKKELKLDSPETIVSITVPTNATAVEIYNAFNEQVQDAKNSSGLDSDFDSVAWLINLVPGLFKRFLFSLLRFLDYFGVLPKELVDVSPFHGSLFITSMGSLGIPPIYHHLFSFGNLPVFIAFGNKYTEMEVQEDGSVVKHRYLDFKATLDDRICNGFYYAQGLKKLKSYFLHPERLDEVVEKKEDIE